MTYQTRTFTCKKCGKDFKIESDSSISNQDYCSGCEKEK